VEKRKLRENPASFIKAKISNSAKRRRFCLHDQVTRLIDECPDVELKFIQFAGFHAGLRKDEIIQARPEWFDLRLNIIHITESEDWKPKDKDKRTVSAYGQKTWPLADWVYDPVKVLARWKAVSNRTSHQSRPSNHRAGDFRS
jgi:integrase